MERHELEDVIMDLWWIYDFGSDDAIRKIEDDLEYIMIVKAEDKRNNG